MQHEFNPIVTETPSNEKYDRVTLLDEFAGKALIGFTQTQQGATFDEISLAAYLQALSMLKQRQITLKEIDEK
jgi:hypothetical protein